WAECVRTDTRFDVKLEGLFCNLLVRSFYFYRCRLRWRTASFEEVSIFRLRVFGQPLDVNELRERAFDRGGVKPQGNEAALSVERVAAAERAGLQLRPVGAKLVGGHAQDEHAGVLQPLLDLRRDVVAGLEFPLV